MSRLPLTVIGGYLGAGKTTLINRLLTGDHGRRLMVMVNDFGAVNIDASLLASASEDTLELTNGCVCCTMGADLFMAVGDVLDRPHRPDHLVIEASGIADPARIAEVARNEPDLSYAGIVTVVDGVNFETLVRETRIAPQLQGQIAVADLVVVSKAMPEDLLSTLADMGASRILPFDADLGPLLWEFDGDVPAARGGHADFVSWVHQGQDHWTRAALQTKLDQRPAGLYRVKGFVLGGETGWHVQVVGKSVEITARTDVAQTQMVGIGLSGQLDKGAVEAWWQSP